MEVSWLYWGVELFQHEWCRRFNQKSQKEHLLLRLYLESSNRSSDFQFARRSVSSIMLMTNYVFFSDCTVFKETVILIPTRSSSLSDIQKWENENCTYTWIHRTRIQDIISKSHSRFASNVLLLTLLQIESAFLLHQWKSRPLQLEGKGLCT